MDLDERKKKRAQRGFSAEAALPELERLAQSFTFENYDLCAAKLNQVDMPLSVAPVLHDLFKQKCIQGISRSLQELYVICERNRSKGLDVTITPDVIKYRLNDVVRSTELSYQNR